MPDAAPPNPHDEVLYPGLSYPQSHPDRLATVARLFGLEPAPVERCRVLELGCGRGSNLIPMAYGLPQGKFLGLDLAVRPVELAQALIADLGLTNVAVRQGDIADPTLELGTYDYIIAHGVYSWVPAEIRDCLLALCVRHLAPHGIAYVSYATYPGAHIRQMVRGMLNYHRERVPVSAADPSPIKGLTQWIQSVSHPRRAAELLADELTRCRERDDAVIVHDELTPHYQPVYFNEFARHAGRHGLQYIAEAELCDMSDAIRPPELHDDLNRWAGADAVAKEQYLDFLRCRAFRQTLLCHHDAKVSRSPLLERMPDFAYSLGNVTVTSGSWDAVRSPKPVELQTAAGAVQSADPGVKAVCKVLSTGAPLALSFAALRQQCAEQLGRAAEAELQELPELLLALWHGGVVQAHSLAPPVVTAPGERPTASPVARCQVKHGFMQLTNLRHAGVSVRDPLARQLLLLLDGTRDRQALVDQLVDIVRATVAKETGHPLQQDPAATRAALANDLDKNLTALAKLALLVG
jgi:methyltransferase-like protein/protein-L-isoaspartate O-methyltransferase